MSRSQEVFTPPSAPTVARCVVDARSSIPSGQFLSQTHCVDWLLDCYNAAVRPSVRAVITEKLAEISHVGLVAVAAFTQMLDHIQLALQVDAAFDHLEIGSR